MFTCKRISEVEYYLAEDTQAREQGITAPQRDRAAYYLDNGAGEDLGTWWRPSGNKPGSLVERGAAVSPQAFRRMAKGCDPRTDEPLIQQQQAERTAGYDCQFAAPKTVSVLWAMADEEKRQKIEQIHRAAVARALDFAQSEGLIVTRRGKGGANKEAVEDAAVAMFMHTTSRSGDPQLHTHAVLLNVCSRQDGSTGSLDNKRILDYQGAMGAMYRAELAAGLERELGLAVSKQDRNFKVEGVPADITELFSKRRAAIELAAEQAGYETANDRERANLTAVATRDRKKDIPEREELEKRWKREVKNAGWSEAAIWSSASLARKSRENDNELKGITGEENKLAQRAQVAQTAIEALTKTKAVFEKRHMLQEVTERMQGIGNADDARAEFVRLEESGAIVKIGMDDDEPVYATPEMIKIERALLRGVMERKAEREFVSPEKIEAAISRRSDITSEQAEAVRHALNKDGVSVIEGSAGTGKSYSLGGVAEAARDAGLKVYVIAPSHKAKDVIRQDTTTDEDSAKAVQGFIMRLADERHKEHIALTSKDCIIVDEAGMVGTREMEALLHHAQEAGAKVILAGDTRQLQPVTAGGPMAAIATLCGTQRIEEIRRQKVDWQRAASNDFATGHADRALEEYDRRGRLHLEKDSTAAMEALARDWRADVERNPEAAMEKPWEARLVLAARNREVSELNATLRQAYREASRLSGEDVAVQAIGRGQNGKLDALQIAAGDRLIFGESVTVGGPAGVTVNNSDMGTVESITPGSDPFVRIKLDKGQVIQGHWSEFVGRRAEDAPPASRFPKVQHAYAVTVHASQGTTVNKAFTYNGAGIGMESAYVAMTRHRDDAAMYVDTARIRDRLEARKSGSKFSIDGRGRGAGKDADEEPIEHTGEIIRQELAAAVRAEVMRSETKVNISDFAPDRAKWAKGEKPITATLSPIPPPKTAEQLVASLEAADRLISQGAAAPRSKPVAATVSKVTVFFPSAQLSEQHRQAEKAKTQERMGDRAKGTAYPVSAPRTPITQGIRGLSLEAELDVFAREIDLESYLQKENYTRQAEWRGGSLWTKGNDKIHVGQPTSGPWAGKWVWKGVQGTEGGGTIVTLMTKLEKVSTMGHARRLCRDIIGEDLDGTKKEPKLKGVVLSPVVKQEKPIDIDPAKARAWWSKMSDEANGWLMNARGIAREVLDKFRSEIRTETTSTTKENIGGACFAHRNDAGEITGFQRKGPKEKPTDERSFSRWSKNGDKIFTRMGDRTAPRAIYVGESSIDLLSSYQHDKQPAHSLLCSFEGRGSHAAEENLARLVASHPEARILLAFDNDKAGQEFTDRIKGLILAQNPAARIEDHRPSREFKDWNDCLQGITRDQANAQAAAHKAAEQLDSQAIRQADAQQVISLSVKEQKDELWRLRDELREDQKAGDVTPADLTRRMREIERKQNLLDQRKEDETEAAKQAIQRAQQVEQEPVINRPKR